MNELVLVLEDEQDICEVLRYALEAQGYRVRCIHEGRQLLPALAEGLPAIVLMDIMLPDADGAELCKGLRLSHPGLPVILLSAGYYRSETIRTRYCPDDFIVKPFDLDEVVIKVRSLIGAV